MSTVALVMPGGSQKRFTRSGTVMPPLGLAYLKANAPREVEVEIIDAEVEDLSLEDTLARVASLRPDFVGLTVASAYRDIIEPFTIGASRELGVPVILGGAYPSSEPGHAIRHPGVSAVVVGEGEKPFASICQVIGSGGTGRLQLGDAPLDGVWHYSEDGILTHSSVRPRTEDLDDLKFPDWRGLPIDAYFSPDARQFPLLSIMTNRGCPFRCTFCGTHAVWGKQTTFRSAESVLKELERDIDLYGARTISFVDDVFTLRRDFVLQLCKHIVDRSIDIEWFCNGRADLIDSELAAAMARAGCRQVYLGMESGNDEILKQVRKAHTVAQAVSAAEALRQEGIALSAGFIVGFPFDTDASVDDTIALAQHLRPEKIQFSIFNPIAGTALAREFGMSGSEIVGYHFAATHDGLVDQNLVRARQWQIKAYTSCGYDADSRRRRS